MRRVGRWPFAVIGALSAAVGCYTLALCVESTWELIRLRWPQPPAQPMRGPAFLAVGGVYVLDIVFMGVATAILAAVAIWGIEPRKRWRECRTRAHAT
jgi:hypothetical protein